MLTDDELDRIDKALRDVTPGPWRLEEEDSGAVFVLKDPDDSCVAQLLGILDDDAEFIAAVNPEVVSKLLGMVRSLKAEVATYERIGRVMADRGGLS